METETPEAKTEETPETEDAPEEETSPSEASLAKIASGLSDIKIILCIFALMFSFNQCGDSVRKDPQADALNDVAYNLRLIHEDLQKKPEHVPDDRQALEEHFETLNRNLSEIRYTIAAKRCF